MLSLRSVVDYSSAFERSTKVKSTSSSYYSVSLKLLWDAAVLAAAPPDVSLQKFHKNSRNFCTENLRWCGVGGTVAAVDGGGDGAVLTSPLRLRMHCPLSTYAAALGCEYMDAVSASTDTVSTVEEPTMPSYIAS
uniref:Uncharacterized protein n=1 Tax=Lygus hesperus TaxID=30085 RepID=A0A146MF43_LYGHE